MAFTVHTSGGATATAGANINAAIQGDDTTMDIWSNEAESMCSNEARYDVVTNFGSLTSSGKQILSSICNAYVAQQMIAYEPESLGLSNATLRMNLLQNHISTGLNQIGEDKIKTYLKIS